MGGGGLIGDNSDPAAPRLPPSMSSPTPAPAAPARILDGRRIAEDLLDSLKVRVDARLAAGGSRPGLAVVLVGGVGIYPDAAIGRT